MPSFIRHYRFSDVACTHGYLREKKYRSWPKQSTMSMMLKKQFLVETAIVAFRQSAKHRTTKVTGVFELCKRSLTRYAVCSFGACFEIKSVSLAALS